MLDATLVVLGLISGAAAAPAPDPAPFAGNYILHTYIGESYFRDRLDLTVSPDGRLEGRLAVPGAFEAAVERPSVAGKTLEFEIAADEGSGSFRALYRLELLQDGGTVIGRIELLPSGRLLGAFVGRRSPP